MHELEKNLSLNVPDLITFICLFYYYQFEYFTLHGPRIQLNAQNNIATVIDEEFDDTHTVYGNIAIDCNEKVICEWKIKILKFNSNDFIYFGIDSSNKSKADEDFSNTSLVDYVYYAFGTDSNTYSNGNAHRVFGYKHWNHEGAKLEVADTVTIELDTMNKKLKFLINDNDLKIEYCDQELILKDQVYHLAIALSENGATVELVNFEIKQSEKK